jgi:nucleotide-binding universal stress UspA family protein
VSDVSGLADLYAVGVVGAITTNLGASATDRKLALRNWERNLMLFTFVIMLAIELSLFVDKPNARVFAFTVLAIGLVLRGLAGEMAQRRKKSAADVSAGSAPAANTFPPPELRGQTLSRPPLVCAVRGAGKTLDFAVQHAIETQRALYVLFVRNVPALGERDRGRKWEEDEEACRIFARARQKAAGHPVVPCYTVSDALPETIVDITATVGADLLVLGASNRQSLVSLLRGDVVRQVAGLLPEDIHLLIYA